MTNTTLAELWRNQRGAVLPLVALLLIVLAGFAALAVDVGYLYVNRAKLQGAADSAVLAAVRELPDAASAQTKASEYATKNLAPERFGTVLLGSDVLLGQWDASTRTFTAAAEPANSVKVTVRMAEANANPVSLFFARALGFDTADITVEATATLGDPPVCLLALEPSASQALYLDSNARVNGPNCAVHVNSSSSSAIHLKSNSSMTAAEICVRGDYRDESTGSLTPTAETNCPQLDDPLATLTAPAIGSCTHNNLVLDNATTTLSPGVYCNGLEIKNNSNVTFNPGVYIIKDKRFFVDSNSRVQGNGVFFYLADKDAVLHFDSNSQVNFTAPTTGAYAGILFFQSRSVTGVPLHRIDSNSNNKQLTGTIYLPKAKLLVDSNGTVGGGSPCMLLIAQRFEFKSNSVIEVAADRLSCPVPMPSVKGRAFRLVS